MSRNFNGYITVFLTLTMAAAATARADSPAASGVRVERQAHLMGTLCTLSGIAANREQGMVALEAGLRALEAVEGQLSTWRTDTPLARLNQAAVGETVDLGTEVVGLLLQARRLWAETGGAFDPAIGRLLAAYDMRGQGRLPDAASLAGALAASGFGLVELDAEAGRAMRRAPGALLDAGAFGKGAGLARAAAALQAAGLADWVIDLGGQVMTAPGAGPVVIPVAHPGVRDRRVGSLRLAGQAAATSGQSERSVEVDGRRLGHILDPRSGVPAPAFGSVTVVSDDPMVADALSTALFVMGPEAGLAFAETRGDIEALFLVDEPAGLSARMTSGMAALIEDLEASPGESKAGAGNDPGDRRLEELEKKIEVLAQEIESLRQGEAAPAAEAPQHGLGPAAAKIYSVKEGVSLAGYGEALYQGFDSSRDDGTPSGKTDEIDFLRAILYLGYKFNDRILFNSEIEFEHASTDKEGEVSVEFGYLDFLLRDEINLRAGLVLMPMGFINELHEPPVFLGARRPGIEQVLIPSTWRENGAGLFGELGPVSYRAYLVTGLDGAGLGETGFTSGGIRGGRQSGSKSMAEDLAVVARLDWEIRPGLTVGGSWYHGDAGQGAILPATMARINASTTIHEYHAEWRWRGIETRFLHAAVSIGDAAQLNQFQGFTGDMSVGERLEGAYYQVGYDVLSRNSTSQSLTPYVRLEEYDTQERVPAGFTRNPANDVEVRTYGVAYKPHPQVVFKLDFQDHDNAAGTGVDQWNLAMGWLF